MKAFPLYAVVPDLDGQGESKKMLVRVVTGVSPETAADKIGCKIRSASGSGRAGEMIVAYDLIPKDQKLGFRFRLLMEDRRGCSIIESEIELGLALDQTLPPPMSKWWLVDNTK